ncbi:acety-l/propionyl-CoA carboxylase subunit alpha, partial [Streptomyces scabiei]|nr:acety-l/propionyl-CoA carboxylase subunit alpha [Streptomyces scabiei]
LPADPPPARGHAIEARLYAEDPARDWAPQTGTLHRLSVPGVRLDTGYEDADTIGVHYDPMLAKAVVHAPTRAEAVRALAGALERATIHGPATNRALLVNSLRHPEFTSARMDTGFYDRHLTGLTDPAPDPYAPLAAALADAAATGDPRFGGWRNLPSRPQVKRYLMAGEEHEVRYRHTRTGPEADGVRVVHADGCRVVLEVDGVRRTFEVARYGDRVHVDATTLTVLPRFPDPTT